MRLRGVRGHCSCAIRMVAIGGMLASTEAAHAQNAVEARAARDTVNARSRPGYEPPPIRFGPLEVAPVLQVDATVTDNLYARSDVKVRDVGIALRPGIVLASRGPNHELAVRADARLERYASHRSEDTQSFDASANGRLNLARRTVLLAEASQAHLIEARGTTGDTLFGTKPIGFDRTIGAIALEQDVGTVRFHLGGRYQRFVYQDRQLDGATIDLSPRDYEVTSGNARVAKGISPGLAGFIDLSLSHSRYTREQPGGVDRNSNGTTVLAGVAFGGNRLVQGEIGLGYIGQKFHDGRFPAIRALAFNGALAWSPTGLTTVRLRAARTFQRSPIVGIAGVREDTFSIAADHELLRNFILRPAITFTRAAFRGGEQRDTFGTAQFATTWLVDTHWQVDFTLLHGLRRNNVPTAQMREYDNNRAMISVRYRL